MLACPRCGAVTATDLEACLRNERADCPFDRLPAGGRPSTFVGAASVLVGLVTAVVISAVLFVSPAGGAGAASVLQALLLIAVYTFVYSISGTFVSLGLLALLHRRLDLVDREGRVVQVSSLLGKTLSFQVVELEPALEIGEVMRPDAMPASVAALQHAVRAADQVSPAASFTRRVQHLSETSDRIVREALELGLVSLLVDGAVRLRPARVRAVWPFFGRAPLADTRVLLLEAGPEERAVGDLETLMLERIRAWPAQRQGDYPLPTTRELVESFKDSEGDFSPRQVLRTVEEDGVAGGSLAPRSRLAVTRLPAPRASGITRAGGDVDGWTRVLEELREREPGALRDLRREIDSVLDGRGAQRTELDRAQRSLRKMLVQRLIGASALLATVVYLVSTLV